MAAHDDTTHDQAIELLPWFVNESLNADEHTAVQAHVASCVICRREIAELEALQQSMGSMPAQQSIPEPDMRRINARIDAQLDREMRPHRVLTTLLGWLGSPFRIAFAAQTIALIAIAVIWLQPNDTDPVFRTLTNAESLPSGHYLRVVFDPTVEELGVVALLEWSGLTLVAGPSERGVVTLRYADDAGSDQRSDIIRQLRDDSRILFAEAVDSGH